MTVGSGRAIPRAPRLEHSRSGASRRLYLRRARRPWKHQGAGHAGASSVLHSEPAGAQVQNRHRYEISAGDGWTPEHGHWHATIAVNHDPPCVAFFRDLAPEDAARAKRRLKRGATNRLTLRLCKSALVRVAGMVERDGTAQERPFGFIPTDGVLVPNRIEPNGRSRNKNGAERDETNCRHGSTHSRKPIRKYR